MSVRDLLMTAAGGTSAAATYVDDVFSTYLYTGTGSSQTITNNIDISTKGGLVWIKSRSNAYGNIQVDSERGATNYLQSNNTNAQGTDSNVVSAFTSSGFTVGSDNATGASGVTYASWTFRKQAKFFDVVTYTGNGTSGRTVSHNLGATPGCIIVKSTSQASDWFVYHRSLGNTKVGFLNTTAAPVTASSAWNNTSPTSTEFTVGNSGDVNDSGQTYVAYLFAHDAGGFGAAGTDNVISCGSYTGNGDDNGPSVTLGYEPQWLLIKRASGGSGDWQLVDNMRGVNTIGAVQRLLPNSNAAEDAVNRVQFNATGFKITNYNTATNESGNTYIYIAIRRPHKPPTTGTEVFSPVAYSGNDGTQTVAPGFAIDSILVKRRNATNDFQWFDRLRGAGKKVSTNSFGYEYNGQSTWNQTFLQNGCSFNTSNDAINQSGGTYIAWNFKRAPGFYDVVRYVGTGSPNAVSHNLEAIPELMFVRSLEEARDWACYHSALGNTNNIILNQDAAVESRPNYWNSTTPTKSTFTVYDYDINYPGVSHIAYLFATKAGISKVGSYTGTGTTKQIDCGFSAGARFVMIKRTDSTGDWYVWDTTRGIVTGNDPYLLPNNTGSSENTSTDYIDPYASGFELSSTAPAAINANGGSYIYLAIA